MSFAADYVEGNYCKWDDKYKEKRKSRSIFSTEFRGSTSIRYHHITITIEIRVGHHHITYKCDKVEDKRKSSEAKSHRNAIGIKYKESKNQTPDKYTNN